MKFQFFHSSRVAFIRDTLQSAFASEFDSRDFSIIDSDPVLGRTLTIYPDYGYNLRTMGETVQERADEEVRLLMDRCKVPIGRRAVRIFIAFRQILWCPGASEAYNPMTSDLTWQILRKLGVKECSVGAAISFVSSSVEHVEIWPAGMCLRSIPVDISISERNREWAIVNPDDPCSAFWKLVPLAEPLAPIADSLARLVNEVRQQLIAKN